MSGVTEPSADERDRGAVLVMSLVLTLILGVVAGSLSIYVSVGLRNSKVTDMRTERMATADAALRIGLERLRANPDTCSGTYTVNESVMTITCTTREDDTLIGPYRIVVETGSATVGIADVQAYTPSDRACGTTTEKCKVLVNSWVLAA